jgi:hypothetical protein
MKLRFVVSHPFRKEREMDGAPRVFGLMSEKQKQVLRLRCASLRMTELFG